MKKPAYVEGYDLLTLRGTTLLLNTASGQQSRTC